MSRVVSLLLLVAAVMAARPAEAANPTTTAEYAGYDVIGSLGIPLITAGMFKLGQVIDDKSAGPVSGGSGEPITSTHFDKFFFVLSLGIDYVGLELLGRGLNVPTTWASTAAGFALGLGVGGVLLGVDVALFSALHLSEKDPGAAALSLLTIAGLSVASTLFVSTDPFHLARPLTKSSPKAMVSASLISLTF
jgi:hypothetical protein